MDGDRGRCGCSRGAGESDPCPTAVTPGVDLYRVLPWLTPGSRPRAEELAVASGLQGPPLRHHDTLAAGQRDREFLERVWRGYLEVVPSLGPMPESLREAELRLRAADDIVRDLLLRGIPRPEPARPTRRRETRRPDPDDDDPGFCTTDDRSSFLLGTDGLAGLSRLGPLRHRPSGPLRSEHRDPPLPAERDDPERTRTRATSALLPWSPFQVIPGLSGGSGIPTPDLEGGDGGTPGAVGGGAGARRSETFRRCLADFANQNPPETADILTYTDGAGLRPEDRPFVPVLCEYLERGMSKLRIGEHGPVSLGYGGGADWAPTFPYVAGDGRNGRREWYYYPGDDYGIPYPPPDDEPAGWRNGPWCKVDGIASWPVFVNVGTGVEPQVIDLVGLAVVIAQRTMNKWRAWASAAGIGGFGIEVTTNEYHVVPGGPGQSDYTLVELDANLYDFMRVLEVYAAGGDYGRGYRSPTPIFIFPQSTEEDQDIAAHNPYHGIKFGIPPSQYWPLRTDLDSGGVPDPSLGDWFSRIVDWWAIGQLPDPGNPPAGYFDPPTVGDVRRAARSLANAAAKLIHEIGHIAFWLEFAMRSSDTLQIDVEGEEDPRPFPDWCAGPELSLPNADRTWRFPRDEAAGVGRHWALTLLVGVLDGLLRRDLRGRLEAWDRFCCERRTWAYDPGWYQGWCPVLQANPDVAP